MSRLPLADLIHRGIVYTLAGVTVYGGVMMVLVHRDTMQRGKGVIAEREALGLPITKEVAKENAEEVEKSLAEQAQAVFHRNS